MEKTKREVSIGEKLIFAWANFFDGGGQTVVSVLYLIFLTNVIGINAAWAATVIMISKIWDAVSDPIMGVITDNTRSKFGRRKPYIFAGGIILIVSMALLWNPISFTSQLAKIIYVVVTYLLYSTVATVISVPYSSLSTEVSTRYEETNRLNFMRQAFSLIATVVASLVPTALFEKLMDGNMTISQFYFSIVFGFGLFFGIPLILTGIFVKERVKYGDKKSSFSIKQFIKPFQVKSFRKLLGIYLCQAVNLDIVSSIVLYFALYVITGMSSTVFMGSFLAMQMVMLPIWMFLVKKVPKTKIYRFGLPLSMVCALFISTYPANGNPIFVYIAAALMSIGVSGAQTMSWIIFPDVVDIAQLGLGERIAGSLSGAMTFTRKAAAAVAIFFVGNILNLTGFIEKTTAVPHPVQPHSAIIGIRAILIFTWVVIMGLGFLQAKKFNLSPALSNRVKYFLQTETLTEEETAEKEALIKELV